MLSMVFKAFYYFFVILELILFLYIVSGWFPGRKVRKMLYELLQPIFALLQLLLRNSVFKSSLGDFTPMLALLLFSYLQGLFYQLSAY